MVKLERETAQQGAVEFRNEFASTFRWEALELVVVNDLSWLRVEAVARATGTPPWFGPVLAVEAKRTAALPM